MSGTGATDSHASFPGYLFGFAGRIGAKQYFIGIAAVVAGLIGALMLAALAMAPTGASGAVLLAVPLLGLAVWILAAVMVQRLRDAGRAPALALLIIVAPILLIYPALELLEAGGTFMVGLLIAVLAMPGFMGMIARDDGLHPNA